MLGLVDPNSTGIDRSILSEFSTRCFSTDSALCRRSPRLNRLAAFPNCLRFGAFVAYEFETAILGYTLELDLVSAASRLSERNRPARIAGGATASRRHAATHLRAPGGWAQFLGRDRVGGGCVQP